MATLTRWFIHNPVAANLIMILILVGGIVSALTMRIEGFPKLPADTVQIHTTFTDAHAEQVDQHITQKIEKALEGLPGVKRIHASSADMISTVYVQKVEGHSLQQLLDDVRLRIDSVATLPQRADKPVITRNDMDFPALIVQLYGDTDQHSLQQLGKQVREALLSQPEISKLRSWGEKKPEISIAIDPSALRQYRLSIDDLVTIIQQSSLTYTAGSLITQGGRISLRADNQALYAPDFARIPVLRKKDGTQLLLGDITTITDGYEDDNVIVRFNGKPALGFEVLIGRKENLLDIAAVVNAVVDTQQSRLPDDVSLSIWADSSHYIADRLSLLGNNAVQGLILVFCLLALFLNVRLAFWVAMGIPIAVAGAIAVMGTAWADYSINDITTFGLIIALGILVDDAVVVGESVFSERRKHPDPHIGTANGVDRVATATIFGVLTTVAAFFPMMLIDNAMGKMLGSFSGVVILALLFSLFESKCILPAHLAAIPTVSAPPSHALTRAWHRIQRAAQAALTFANTRLYQPLLRGCIRHRYAACIIFLSLATLGLGLINSGKIHTVFFPEIPGQTITVTMEMDPRAPFQLTVANTQTVETVANQLNTQLQQTHQLPTPPIKHMLVAIVDDYSIEIYAELSPPEQRGALGTLAILQHWQQHVGTLEGTTKLTFSGTEDTGGGFAVQLFSKNPDALAAASASLANDLQNIDGISHLRDDLNSGKPELKIQLTPEAYHAGFTDAALSQYVSHHFGGAEAQRIQRNHQEINVMVRNQKDQRNTMTDLMNSVIHNDQGQPFPLHSITQIRSSYAINYIARRDGKRVNTLAASINKAVVSPSEIEQYMVYEIIPHLATRYPDVTVSMAGELEEIGNLKGGMVKALLLTCVLIFVLLAIPLKSYWQPLIIMAVIPFGFIGAAIGHGMMGLPLSLLSFLGMLALAGVVVNDCLVMITRYNQACERGLSLPDALLDAGSGRFRAIFLTTATTVTGLVPLMNETSEQAQYLIPAAVSLAFGEIFATAITLLLVPILIAISADIAHVIRPKPAPAAG